MTNISDDECVAMRYDFENVEGKTFLECSTEEREEIINAKIEGRCELYGKRNCAWAKAGNNALMFNYVYRTLKPAPTPNEIDWSQFPAWVNYCFTLAHGGSFVTDKLVPRSPSDGYSISPQVAHCEVTDFPGFKRGTVAWQNSLLIKPAGK